jgi:excisionase family DNA binding protein
MATAKVESLTVDQVAARWGVHPQTVWRELRRGNLRAIKVGRATRIRETEIQRYEHRNQR